MVMISKMEALEELLQAAETILEKKKKNLLTLTKL
jgi:hypothetical protein